MFMEICHPYRTLNRCNYLYDRAYATILSYFTLWLSFQSPTSSTFRVKGGKTLLLFKSNGELGAFAITPCKLQHTIVGTHYLAR